MNLVGKILTVIILVMSVVFCGLTMAVYATHKNWQETVEKTLVPKLDDARTENETLKTKIGELELAKQFEENDAVRSQAALQTTTLTHQGEIAALEQRNATIEEQLGENIGALAATGEELAQLQVEVKGLRTGIAGANFERDKQFKEALQLTDQLHNAEMERERLAQRNLDLAADLTKARQVLETADMSIDDSPFPPEGTHGIVTAVPRADLIEISLGEDDGLRKGHQLEVYRVRDGRQVYVGRVKVVSTSYDKAACQVDPNFRQSNIERQDRVKITRR